MANGNGYAGPTTPVVSFFTKEQRARLEALTFARELVGKQGPGVTLSDWFRTAEYIIKGTT